MMKTKPIGKILVMTLALLLAMAMLPAAAFAMPTQGNLHIHKYEMATGTPGAPNDGTETTPPASATPLEGIGFTVKKILPDPTTGLYPANAAEAKTAGLYDVTFTAQTVTTLSTGIALFSNLPSGVYLVQESSSTVNGVTYAPVEDFLVAVPMTTADGTDWLTDVHVYPKNQSMEPEKTVSGGPNGTNDVTAPITWTITTPISAGIEKFVYYTVTDQIDTLLNVVPDSVKVYTVSSKSAPATENTAANLVAEANYTEDLTAGNLLSITFNTTTGLGLLKTRADEGAAYLRVVYQTTLTDEALGLVVDNGASLSFKNEDNVEFEQEIPDEDKPVVYTGTIGITKYDEENAPLAGASFKVARTRADALAGTFLKTVGNVDITATSDGDGKLELRGIPYAIEGEAPDSAAHSATTFWIVETQAPSGYNMLPEPVEVSFVYSTAADGGNTVNYFNNAIAIHNAKSFVLPQTGAAGIIISTIVGSILLCAVIVIIARRKTGKNA